MSPSIAILTFAVGADYKRAMEPGMASKRAYAARYGYAFHEGGEDVWDRRRPIAWSKIRFIQKYLDAYDYVFWTDGDVILTNPDIRLEDLFGMLMPDGKDMVWCRDACGNLNNGNVFFRGRSAWVRDFLDRCYAQTDLIHHIWWDNAAFIRVFEANASDRDRIVTVEDPALFNAYLFGRTNRADDTSCRLYRPGDWLVHFAGVYDPWNIHRCMVYVQRCAAAGAFPDTSVLNAWRLAPPLGPEQAVADAAGAPLGCPG